MLRTPRLLLRPLRSEDAGALFAYASIPEAVQFTSWPVMRSEAGALALIRELQWMSLWVWAAESKGQMVGTIDLRPRDQALETGYLYAPEVWGQGIATEALDAVLHWGFATLHPAWVEARCHPENRASIQVLRKMGFQADLPSESGWYPRFGWVSEQVFRLSPERWALFSHRMDRL